MSEEIASFCLMGGAAVAAFFAVRGGIDAVLTPDQPAPGKRAILHAVLTAIISVAAVLHRPALLDIGVGVPFSASVAAMTLALGVVVFVALPETAERPHPPHRLWAFLLPTSFLALLIGFSGKLTASSGLILAVEGAAILLVVAGPSKQMAVADSGKRGNTGRSLRFVQFLFAFVLAVVAGWGMVHGAASLALHNPAFRPGVAGVLLLGPAIVMPMIPPLATLAEVGRREEATSALVGFALINLTVVLPLVAVLQQLMQKVSAATQAVSSDGLLFPLLVWRLDTVILCTVGLLLLPTATGRWKLSRVEGLGLIGVYVFYLFLTLLTSR